MSTRADFITLYGIYNDLTDAILHLMDEMDASYKGSVIKTLADITLRVGSLIGLDAITDPDFVEMVRIKNLQTEIYRIALAKVSSGTLADCNSYVETEVGNLISYIDVSLSNGQWKTDEAKATIREVRALVEGWSKATDKNKNGVGLLIRMIKVLMKFIDSRTRGVTDGDKDNASTDR